MIQGELSFVKRDTDYEANRDTWMKRYIRRSCLQVLTAGKAYIFWDSDCGFDIFQKATEINDAIAAINEESEVVRREAENAEKSKRTEELNSQKKKDASDNDGEKAVEYALKWFYAENPGIFSVSHNCESKYRYNCILLKNQDYIDDIQEYDHILVGTGHVVVIETKHWRGNIQIRPDGKWMRDNTATGNYVGIQSPAYQMRRHEKLIKSILPENVSVHSLLCFSNDSVVIDGKPDSFEYPIIYVEQLQETLETIFSNDEHDSKRAQSLLDLIETHKVNVMT